MHFGEGSLKQIYEDREAALVGAPAWVIRCMANVGGVPVMALYAARSWETRGDGGMRSRGHNEPPLVFGGPARWLETTMELDADVVSAENGPEVSRGQIVYPLRALTTGKPREK